MRVPCNVASLRYRALDSKGAISVAPRVLGNPDVAYLKYRNNEGAVPKSVILGGLQQRPQACCGASRSEPVSGEELVSSAKSKKQSAVTNGSVAPLQNSSRKSFPRGWWFRHSLALLGLLFLLAAVPVKAATPASPLQLSTPDSQLQCAFDWAKTQAMAYVSEDQDPVQYWYEAALPGRHAFCMRDVSHQVMGAEALGLAKENRTMLTLFGEGISEPKDWASFWEIDRDGKPSPADYLSDEDFWYNLPANFDVMGAALRMYMWTGDETYIEDPAFLNFYRHTVTGYIRRWQLQPDNVLSRPRIMNRHLATGKFVDARGIPGYTESRKDYIVGTDLLAAEYRALRLYGELLRMRGDATGAPEFDAEAAGIARVLQTRGWNSADQHFYGALKQNEAGVGLGDAFILYFNAAIDPKQRQLAIAELQRQTKEPDPGIEEQSYRPEILFHYDDPDDARSQILDLSRPDRKRRSYPEVSYAIIGSIVTGMMGVRVVPESAGTDRMLAHNVVIETLPRLSEHTPSAELNHLPVRRNVIDVRHVRGRSSSLTNLSGPRFTWRASFDGSIPFLLVNGRKSTTQRELTVQRTPVSFVDVSVAPGETVTVAR